MYSFSIIIPIYNERENIFKLIDEVKKFLNNKKYLYEIIIVNDFSNDLSKSDLDNLNKINKVKLINNSKNLGQSLSIHKGIMRSKYSTIVTLDGDGQNNPKDILKLLEIYNINNYKLVGGIRNKRKDNIIKIFSSKIANFIRSLILNDNCKDTGCSLKVFDKEVFLEFPIFDGIHRFLPALFKGYGNKTFFVSVDHRARMYGLSKYGTLDRLIKGVKDIIKVKKIIIKRNNKYD